MESLVRAVVIVLGALLLAAVPALICAFRVPRSRPGRYVAVFSGLLAVVAGTLLEYLLVDSASLLGFAVIAAGATATVRAVRALLR